MNRSNTLAETAQFLLRAIGQDALVQYFHERLKVGKELPTRPQVIRAHARLAGTNAIGLMRQIARDTSELSASRAAAILSLSQLAEMLTTSSAKQDTKDLLIELLKDNSREVRSAGALGLVFLDAKQAMQELRQVYEGQKLDALAEEEVRKYLATFRTFTIENIMPNVDHFVGRTEELQAAKTGLEKARIVAVIGMGGIGKTALAAKYAQDTFYDLKIWLSCMSQSDLADLALETLRQIKLALGNSSLERVPS